MGRACGRGWRRVAFVSAVLMLAHLAGLQGWSRATDFTYHWVAQTPGVSLSGHQWVAFPGSAFSDCGQVELMPNSPQVWRLDRPTDALIPCQCPGTDCFPITVGEAYYVQVSVSVDPVITGTDQSALLTLKAAGPGSLSGNNAIGLPFAVTGDTLFRASDLMNSIGMEDVASVQRFIRATDTFESYTGRKGTPVTDFTLVDGVGYQVKMLNTRYWGSLKGQGCGVGCTCATGVWQPNVNNAALANAFCAQFPANGNFTCTVSGIDAYITTNNTGCQNIKKKVTFTTLGPTTTAAHPFGYRICCNSPLSDSIGIDGEAVQSVDDRSITVGEITVTSTTLESSVPASSPWALGVIVLLILVGGVYLLSRWSM